MSVTGASSWLSVCSAPRTLRRVHAVLTIQWLFHIPAVLLMPPSWRIMYLIILSIVTALLSSWSAWQSARVEVVQDDDANVQQVLDEVRKLSSKMDTRR